MKTLFRIFMLTLAFSSFGESKLRTPQAPIGVKPFPQADSPLSILAQDFDHAMIALNQSKDDIHVGHLLAACEKLEKTVRNMGFTSSANDMASNISKIRKTYRQLPLAQRDSMPLILQYEQDVGITETARITDASATMGFLWLGRAINYQYDMFQYILENPEASPYDAASHAYGATVKPHLSWPLQRLGQAALTKIRAMQKETILARMGGFDEDEYTTENECETKKGIRQVLASWNPIIQKWNQVLEAVGIESL